MSPDIKSKKRKAIMPGDDVSEVKKVKQTASDVLPKKRKAAIDADSIPNKKSRAPKYASAEGKKSKNLKEDDAAEEEELRKNGEYVLEDSLKSSKNTLAGDQKLTHRTSGNDMKIKQTRKVKAKGLKLAEKDSGNDDVDNSASEYSEEVRIDDQTDALLKGFESEDDDEKNPDDQGYEAGQEFPTIDKKIRNKSKAVEKASTSDEPGVVYVGRIPHGFYEQEMKQYFSQFGDISRLRLSRNRKTGKSKHFAFVEFKSAEVAEIVSKTMDNYLLFGHILKCKLVTQEQIHKDVWAGANKRFKRVPWNKMEGRKLKQGMTKAGWDMRVGREETRRAQKKAAMQLMDYEFESPKLKPTGEIPKKRQQALTLAAATEPEEDETQPNEAPKEVEILVSVAATEGTSTKKRKAKDPSSSPKLVTSIFKKAEGSIDLISEFNINEKWPEENDSAASIINSPEKAGGSHDAGDELSKMKQKKKMDKKQNASIAQDNVQKLEKAAFGEVAGVDSTEKAFKVKKSKKNKTL